MCYVFFLFHILQYRTLGLYVIGVIALLSIMCLLKTKQPTHSITNHSSLFWYVFFRNRAVVVKKKKRFAKCAAIRNVTLVSD